MLRIHSGAVAAYPYRDDDDGDGQDMEEDKAQCFWIGTYLFYFRDTNDTVIIANKSSYLFVLQDFLVKH